MKLKKLAFQQQTLEMDLVNTFFFKYPICTMKYTAVFFKLRAYISAGGPGYLV